ncbi:MAG: hypothetical protein UR66_C0005G0090 [Candidatus Moranbacteria bacterium GW2011_GWE1_35_17]|nr:MAG: hypothetical protein UR66_C0005G0090 [Candidatus Moranbacteria bacterium GW2011_GWE1_35_17]KKP81518.1 MAG: hypothetical protein UR82_C0059G0007 [Candidatus Moranbacteria bacterium GW2011_GWF1_35_5]
MNTIQEKAIIVLSSLLSNKFSPEKIKEILTSGISYRYKPRKKKDGSIRDCYAPAEDLKALQQSILSEILHNIPVHKNLCGFVPGVAMKNGVEAHLRETREKKIVGRWIVKVDIKNCFPSVKIKVLKNMFEDIFTGTLYAYGVDNPAVFFEFCDILIKLTTHKGGLIQGAPTSPYLTNLVISWAGIVDDLEHYCNTRHGYDLIFSIYADDITVSPTITNKASVKKIIHAIEKSRIFRVNPKKTTQNDNRHRSHRITGMSIHQEFDQFGPSEAWTTLSRKKQKFYRGRIQKVIQFLQQGCEPSIKEHGVSINQARGYITWTRHVCGERIPSCLKKVIAVFEELVNKQAL